MNNRIRFVPVLVIGLFSLASGQNITYLHTIMVGSEGNDRVRASDAEDNLNDWGDYVAASLGGRVKSKIVFSGSKTEKASLAQTLASVYATGDSTDLVVTVWAGGWERNPGTPELSSFALPGSEKISAEYLVNFTSFLAPENVLVFVIAPESFQFPLDVLSKYDPSTISSGKHIIVVRSRERRDYDDLLDVFTDLLKGMREPAGIDTNKDGWVTTTEWIREFSKKASAARLTLNAFQLSRAPEFRVAQVKR